MLDGSNALNCVHGQGTQARQVFARIPNGVCDAFLSGVISLIACIINHTHDFAHYGGGFDFTSFSDDLTAWQASLRSAREARAAEMAALMAATRDPSRHFDNDELSESENGLPPSALFGTALGIVCAASREPAHISSHLPRPICLHGSFTCTRAPAP